MSSNIYENQWCIVDNEGNIIQKDSKYFSGKQIGQTQKDKIELSLNEYYERFDKLIEKYDRLESLIVSASNKSEFQLKLDGLLSYIKQADVLGDLDDLYLKLNFLQNMIDESKNVNLKDKHSILKSIEIYSNEEASSQVETEVRHLMKKWNLIGAIPEENLLDLSTQFNELTHSILYKCKALKKQITTDNQEEKTKICDEADTLSSSRAWKSTHDKIVNLKEQWNKIGSDRSVKTKKLQQRFDDATEKFYNRRSNYYEKLEQNNHDNLLLKEKFCSLAEEICESTEWVETENKLKKISDDWQKVGTVPIQNRDIVWNRFKLALDTFYNRKTEYYETQKEVLYENQLKKEKLCEFVESIGEPTGWKSSMDKIKEIHAKWNEIGIVSVAINEMLELRLKTAIDIYYQATRELSRELKKEKQKNLTHKRELCEAVEALKDSENWEPDGERIKQFQKEWKSIGPVLQSKNKEIWERFHTATEMFFARRNKVLNQNYEENLVKKTQLCETAESLLSSEEWHETAEKLKSLQQEWNSIGLVSKTKSKAVWHRFRTAVDKFFENRQNHFDTTIPNWQENLKVKESICVKLEEINKHTETTPDAKEVMNLQK